MVKSIIVLIAASLLLTACAHDAHPIVFTPSMLVKPKTWPNCIDKMGDECAFASSFCQCREAM